MTVKAGFLVKIRARAGYRRIVRASVLCVYVYARIRTPPRRVHWFLSTSSFPPTTMIVYHISKIVWSVPSLTKDSSGLDALL